MKIKIRNKMKKNTLLALSLIAFLVFPVLGLAMDIEPLDPGDISTTPTELLDWMEEILLFVFYGVMVLAILFMLVAAFTFLTAGGSPEKIATARQMLIYAVIGIAVALLAYAIPFIVGGILTI